LALSDFNLGSFSAILKIRIYYNSMDLLKTKKEPISRYKSDKTAGIKSRFKIRS
jgi:hypothetical protein